MGAARDEPCPVKEVAKNEVGFLESVTSEGKSKWLRGMEQHTRLLPAAKEGRGRAKMARMTVRALNQGGRETEPASIYAP